MECLSRDLLGGNGCYVPYPDRGRSCCLFLEGFLLWTRAVDKLNVMDILVAFADIHNLSSLM